MRRLTFILLFVVLSASSKTKLSDDDCKSLISTDLGVLKSSLRSINLLKPNEDLLVNIQNEDFRFISLDGLYEYFPGLEFPSDDWLVKRFGKNNIKGASDAIENEEHGILIEKVAKYSALYNKYLKSYLLKERACKPINQ